MGKVNYNGYDYTTKRDYLTGNDIYRTVITSVEDWYYYKYL